MRYESKSRLIIEKHSYECFQRGGKERIKANSFYGMFENITD
jgi:hypothetical protein